MTSIASAAVLQSATGLLAQQTALFSLAVLAVAVLRWPLLRLFGAAAAAQMWLLLPLVMSIACLPRAPVLQQLLVAPLKAWAGLPSTSPAALLPDVQGGPAHAALLLVWGVGVLLMAALLVHRQRAFLRGLIRHPAPLPWRSPAGSSPALYGMWRPRCVLPLDFEQRFDATEQSLILAHESEHQRRDDNTWNLLGAGLLALFWFNPLAWWALHRFRADQELACDATVLARHPTALSSYARAMLKSQGLLPASSLASSWLAVHPLIERTQMLKTHRRLFSRRAAGQRFALVLALLGAGAAYAAQGGAPAALTGPVQRVDLQMKLKVAGVDVASPRMVVELGRSARLNYRADPSAGELAIWSIELITTQLPDGRMRVVSHISSGEPLRAVGGEHVLITEAGKPFGLKVSQSPGGQTLQSDGVARLLRAVTP